MAQQRILLSAAQWAEIVAHLEACLPEEGCGLLAGRADPDELVPFGGSQAHKAFALAVGLELLAGALAGPDPGAVMLVVPPEHDPVPAFRALAAGLRLPGDS